MQAASREQERATMSTEKEEFPTPESIAKYVKQNTLRLRKHSSMMGMSHHMAGQEVVRKDDHKGHHIVIRTTYKITVDGKEVTGHVMLTNAGQVQYHGLPNYSFDSAVDLVKALIDNFPEDFEEKKHSSGMHGGMKMASLSGTAASHGQTGNKKAPGRGATKSPKTSKKVPPKRRVVGKKSK
jgi:hypothetical protein